MPILSELIRAGLTCNKTVAEALGNYDLSGTNLALPFLLGYADDLIILTDNIQDLEKFIEEFSDVTHEVGLHINPQKCELLLRDPNNNDHWVVSTFQWSRS